jgi:uncharacterized protein (TIGR02594 family)
MNKTFALITIFFITSCSQHVESNDRPLPRKYLVYDAYSYIGLDENTHRNVLKSVIGVDPVYTEWCAAFVNTILKQNEYPTSATVSQYPLTARSFLSLGVPTEDPEIGDIVVFKRGEPWQGHVAFYVGTVMIDGVEHYNVLGGNQNDKVSIKPYSTNKVLSIRRI